MDKLLINQKLAYLPTKKYMPDPTIKFGRYRHYKGKNYRVIGLAKHSETLEEMVVYEALYDNTESKLWVRPKTMFLENVAVDGKIRPRFEYLGE